MTQPVEPVKDDDSSAFESGPGLSGVTAGERQ